MGFGKAQVINLESAETVPAFISAIYTLLHLDTHKSGKYANQVLLPRPKWCQNKEGKRHTKGDIINNVKAQVWAKAIGLNFSGFVNQRIKNQNLSILADSCKSAMF